MRKHFNTANILKNTVAALLLTTAVTSTVALSWVEDHDPYTLSQKGFSAETNRIVQDAVDRMEGRSLVPMRTKSQQAWYNFYTNRWAEPLEPFGRDVIDEPSFQPRKDKIVYPFRNPEEAHFGRTNVPQNN